MSFGYFLSCFLQVFGEFGEFWSDLASLSLFMANASFCRVSVRVFFEFVPVFASFSKSCRVFLRVFGEFMANYWRVSGQIWRVFASS